MILIVSWIVLKDREVLLYLKRVLDNDLRDLDALGARFTWYKRGLSQLLDRVICNMRWDSFASNCSVRNIQHLKSDHRPILFSFQPTKSKGNRLFRCLAGWFCRAYFRNVVSRSWNNDTMAMDSLENLKGAISEWNKKVYGNIFQRKRKLVGELKRVQKVLYFRFLTMLQERETTLRHEIEEVLSHEELLWFQKSKAEWLRYRDCNTSYFHNRTLVRHKRNKIEGLIIGNDWNFEEEELRNHVKGIFIKIFTLWITRLPVSFLASVVFLCYLIFIRTNFL